MPDLAPTSSSEDVLKTFLEQHIDSYRVPKIPAFFCDDPALWFLQVESSLSASRITTQKTMADIVVSALTFDEISSIRDILSATPQPQDLYDRIKARIIASYSTSAEARLCLKGEVITDGKPSQILNRLRNLNDGSCSDDVIRAIFMKQLPTQIRALLAMSRVSDLQEFAELADKVVEASGTSSTAVSTVSSRDLENKVARLEKQ
ncbi:uncharacterized protein LOC144477816, partial [Augochlora pura]